MGIEESKGALPLDGLLAALQNQGFVISPEQVLRLRTLLRISSPLAFDTDFASLLCPVFATNAFEQITFHEVFRNYYGSKAEWSRVLHLDREQQAREQAEPLVENLRLWPALLPWLTIVITVWVAAVAVVQIYSEPKDSSSATSTPLPAKSAVRATPTPATVAAGKEPTPTPVATPTDARPTSPIRLPLLALSAMVPLGLFGLFEIAARRRRRLALERSSSEKPPFTWPISASGLALWDLASERFMGTVRKLRTRQNDGSLQLDLDRTIEATLAGGGFPTAVYRPTSRVPEYLLFIERETWRDHLAELQRQLAMSLEAENLHLTHYFYAGDPRACHPEEGNSTLRLADLQQSHPQHRVIFFGTGDGFLNALTGEWEPWTEFLNEWRECALLTPVAPAAWGRRERMLGERFSVLPANLDGLQRLSELWEMDGFRAGCDGWKGPSEEELEMNEDMDIPALRAQYQPEVFEWLCTCALYPELHWELTLRLGSMTPLPTDLVREENLLSLLRIPWFRSGIIPDPWREKLIAALPEERVRVARTTLIEVLRTSIPDDQSSAAANQRRIEIALNTALTGDLPDRERIAAEQVLRQTALPEQCDHVALKELRAATRLPFELPDWLSASLFPQGIPLFGSSTIARLFITLLTAGACILFLQSRPASWFDDTTAWLKSAFVRSPAASTTPTPLTPVPLATPAPNSPPPVRPGPSPAAPISPRPVTPVPLPPASPAPTTPTSPRPVTTVPPATPLGVPLKPFVPSTPSNSPPATTSTWTTYEQGKAPKGKTITPLDVKALVGTDASSSLYLTGTFKVTARSENKVVLRDKSAGSAGGTPVDEVRVIVDFPAGIVPPSENSTVIPDTSSPYQIQDIRKGGDTFNVYVREIISNRGGATAPVSTPVGELPYAKAVPGKSGYVTSPYDPYKGYIDVRGFPTGTEVRDPYSGKTFVVPPFGETQAPSTPQNVPAPADAKLPVVPELEPVPGAPQEKESKADAPKERLLAFAKPLSGKPGFVYSPFALQKGQIDVRGYPPGTEVNDPYSGKTFLVPEFADSENQQSTPKPTTTPVAKAVPKKTGYVLNPFSAKKEELDVRGFPAGTTLRDSTSGQIFVVPKF